MSLQIGDRVVLIPSRLINPSLAKDWPTPGTVVEITGRGKAKVQFDSTTWSMNPTIWAQDRLERIEDGPVVEEDWS